jgi:hypothetical protein
MRIATALAFAALAYAALAATTTTALAGSDVRVLALPDSVHGAWAPSTEACSSVAQGRLDIAARSFNEPDVTCEVAWITVTATRYGPAYSARAVCTQNGTGQKDPPSYLIVTPGADNTLLVRRPTASQDGELMTYRKC